VKAFAFKTSRLVKPVSFKVLDSVHEDGVKLVKIDPEKISDIQMAFPGVRVVREVFFNKAVIPKQKIAPGVKKLTVGKSIKITLCDSQGKEEFRLLKNSNLQESCREALTLRTKTYKL